jgi:hypothetical protein
MAGYWRFWGPANVPPFRKLRSDYPLFYTSCNCPRRHGWHVHRPLSCNRITSSGARWKTATLVLGLCWHRENLALRSKHGLGSAYLHKFAWPDAGPISLNTERKHCSLTCASSPTLSVCTTLFERECDLEDHNANVELPALELQAASCFDKRNVTYGSLNLGFVGSQAAQHGCSVDRQISSTQ